MSQYQEGFDACDKFSVVVKNKLAKIDLNKVGETFANLVMPVLFIALVLVICILIKHLV